ncbi:MAG: Ig-like domain-containing protein [Candidatus Sericytochromatia bacterium]
MKKIFTFFLLALFSCEIKTISSTNEKNSELISKERLVQNSFPIPSSSLIQSVINTPEPEKFTPILSVFPKILIIRKGDKNNIFAQVKISENELYNDFNFISENEKIVSIDSKGVLSGNQEGKTSVYVISKNKMYDKLIEIEVRNDKEPFLFNYQNYSSTIPNEVLNFQEIGEKLFLNLIPKYKLSNIYSNYNYSMESQVFNINGDSVNIESIDKINVDNDGKILTKTFFTNYLISIYKKESKIKNFELLKQPIIDTIKYPLNSDLGSSVYDVGTSARVEIDNLGNFVVIWSDSSTFYAKKFNKNGEVLVNQNILFLSSDMKAIKGFKSYLSANGKYLIVTDRIGKVYIFDDKLKLVRQINIGQKAERIDNNSYITFDLPLVSINDNAEFVVIWRQESDLLNEFWGEKFDSNGNPICSLFKITDNLTKVNNYNNRIENIYPILDNNGDLIITWINKQNLDTNIKFIPLTTKNKELNKDIFLTEGSSFDLLKNELIKNLAEKYKIKFVIENNIIGNISGNMLNTNKTGISKLYAFNEKDYTNLLELMVKVLPKCQIDYFNINAKK